MQRLRQILFLGLLMPLLAQADLDRGWSVGAALGGATATDMGKNDVVPTASALNKSDFSNSFTIGYRHNLYWTFDAGYLDLGRVKYTGATTQSTGRVRGHTFFVEANGRLPVYEQLLVMAKLGVYRGDYRPDSTLPDTIFQAGKSPHNDRGLSYGIGALYMQTPSLGFNADWRHLTGYLRHHVYLVGVVYQF